jgi:2-oxoglutarate ferredoxin oxidoreductase subunit beta
MSAIAEKYLRQRLLPHIWCPGCGHGILLGAILRAIEKVGLDRDKTVMVSGIGCSSRATGYMDFDTLHTTHGRALAFATGIKIARPDLKVVVVTGDGDAAAIGGNHLIHACRRNVDITTVCFNNNVYGMTSGQHSPLTPFGHMATTAPYGNVDHPFDLCDLVAAAGATFVARGTAYHVTQLVDLIALALENKGFSFVEAYSQCPTYYGRRNKLGSAVDMLEWYKKNSVPVKTAATKDPQELKGKIVTGVLKKAPREEFTEEYQRVIDTAMARLKGGRS